MLLPFYGRHNEGPIENMDRRRAKIIEVFGETYGNSPVGDKRNREALRWLVRWRVFFMACAELWSYAKSTERIVSHYLFAGK
jgi:cyclopropane-fatty-acyl-phospholipid synthase